MLRKFFACSKPQQPEHAKVSGWQKVTAVTGLGRLGVALVRLWHEWKNGEGPEAFL